MLGASLGCNATLFVVGPHPSQSVQIDGLLYIYLCYKLSITYPDYTLLWMLDYITELIVTHVQRYGQMQEEDRHRTRPCKCLWLLPEHVLVSVP